MMSMNDYRPERNVEQIRCHQCDEELVLRRVRAVYLKSEFPTRVLGCPNCGQVYVSENLTMNKIAEIEHTLEEK
ncbi:hypothetical protein LJC27_01340 [Christensenellaceae bacterium OttesenSCG-928-M15]|nr:hypothetical protein [Christensenellaceae bacterium OttesenSCG-928-M15]